MQPEQQIVSLLTAVNALQKLPVMKLAENKTLLGEIKSIVNSENMKGIMHSIRYNFDMKNAEIAQNAEKAGKWDFQDDKFLHLYAKYQSHGLKAYEVANKVGAIQTRPASHKTVQAFNSKKTEERNIFLRPEVQETKAAKEFAEAFQEAIKTERAAARNSIFSNVGLQINSAADPTNIGSFIDYSPYVYNYQYYLGIPTLAPTIDRPLSIATKDMPLIEFEDGKLSEEMEKHLRRIMFIEKIRKACKYSDMSPRGSLIVPIIENGKVRFNVFNDTQFTYSTAYQYSRIDFYDNPTGVSQIYCLGHMLQNGVTAHFTCPGFEPLFAIGKNKIFQLKTASEAINIYLYTIKVLCVRAQTLIHEWGGDGQNDELMRQTMALTRKINTELSLSEAVPIPEGQKLDIISNNISPGFADVAPMIKEYQGMLSGLMGDYYYGSSQAYAANNFNMHASHQNVRSSIQEEMIEPIVRFAVNSILQYDVRFKAYREQYDKFDVKFKELYEPTEGERVDTESKKIDNLIKMRQYPELEEMFKKQNLMPKEFTFKEENTPAQGNRPQETKT